MDIHSIRRQNLRRLIDTFAGGSVAEFSRKYEITEARLSQLLSATFRDGQNFGEKMARKIEGICDIATFSLDQIPEGYVGDVDAVIRPVKRLAQTSPEESRRIRSMIPPLAFLPVVNVEPLPDRDAYEFAKRYTRDHEMISIGIRPLWMQQKGFTWDHLIGFEIESEGMEPSLHVGDFVVVNTVETEPADGAVFLFAFESEIIARRVVRDSGQWWLLADNADHRRFPRKAFHPPSVKIIGRIVRKDSEFI